MPAFPTSHTKQEEQLQLKQHRYQHTNSQLYRLQTAKSSVRMQSLKNVLLPHRAIKEL